MYEYLIDCCCLFIGKCYQKFCFNNYSTIRFVIYKTFFNKFYYDQSNRKDQYYIVSF